MSLDKKNRLSILLIEDNPGDQVLVSDYLHDEFPNVDLDVADNFKQAQNLLQKQTANYKILLLDLRLPDIDPNELITEIIALSPSTPIVILTGQDDIQTAIKALTLGVTDYLLKDEITSKGLRKSITYAFERKHIDKQLHISVKRYQELFKLNPQPTWVINTQTEDFLEVNDAATKKYGFSREEFLNMKIRQIDSDYEKQNLKQHLSEDEDLKNDDLHSHTLKNGNLIQVKLYGNSINYQGIEATLLMAIDVTETKSYINKIEHQNKQLQEIAWEQSHLVREPLTRLMGIINRLEEKHLQYIAEVDEECSFLLKHVLNSAHEIDDVVRSIVQKSNAKQK